MYVCMYVCVCVFITHTHMGVEVNLYLHPGNQTSPKATFLAIDLPVIWKRGSQYVSGHVGSITIYVCFIDPTNGCTLWRRGRASR